MAFQPSVSVIVPVYNDVGRLRLCLDALMGQSLAPERWELLVVDNGSTEDVPAVVRGYPNARCLLETWPTSYAARNRGLAAARSEVLAFTDADAIPAPDWLERGLEAFVAEPDCGLVAGRVELCFQDPARPTAVELYESRTYLQQQKLETTRFGATANLWTSRSVVERVGVFRADLKSAGDVEWGRRVHALGLRQIYAAQVLVRHPARRTLRELYRKTIRIEGGRFDLLGATRTGVQRAKSLFQALRPPLRPCLRLWRDQSLPARRDRLKVVLLAVLVKYMRAAEHVRLQWTGRSRQFR